MSDEKKETQGAAENQKLSTKENVLQTVKFALFSASAGIIQIATYTLFYEACHFDLVYEVCHYRSYVEQLSC